MMRLKVILTKWIWVKEANEENPCESVEKGNQKNQENQNPNAVAKEERAEVDLVVKCNNK